MRNSKRNILHLQKGAELLPDDCFKFEKNFHANHNLRKGDELSDALSQLPEHVLLSRQIDIIALFINNEFAIFKPSEYEQGVINNFTNQFPDRKVHEAELTKLLDRYYQLLQTM